MILYRLRNNNANIQLSDINITYKDKETGEILNIGGDVDVTIPTNTVKAGKYTVTITAKAGRKVTGSPLLYYLSMLLTLRMLIFKKGTTPMESTAGGINSLTVSKYYTGEPVTFTTDEIGVPTIGSGTPLEKL